MKKAVGKEVRKGTMTEGWHAADPFPCQHTNTVYAQRSEANKYFVREARTSHKCLESMFVQWLQVNREVYRVDFLWTSSVVLVIP